MPMSLESIKQTHTIINYKNRLYWVRMDAKGKPDYSDPYGIEEVVKQQHVSNATLWFIKGWTWQISKSNRMTRLWLAQQALEHEKAKKAEAERQMKEGL